MLHEDTKSNLAGDLASVQSPTLQMSFFKKTKTKLVKRGHIYEIIQGSIGNIMLEFVVP